LSTRGLLPINARERFDKNAEPDGRIILPAHSNLDAITKVAGSASGICFSEAELVGPILSLPALESRPEPGSRLLQCLEAIEKGGDAFRLVEVVCAESHCFHLDEKLEALEAEETIRATILGKIKANCGEVLAGTGGNLLNLTVRERYDADDEVEMFSQTDSFGVEAFGTRFRDQFCDPTTKPGWYFFGRLTHCFVWGNSTADAARTLFQSKFPVWNVHSIEDGAVLYDL